MQVSLSDFFHPFFPCFSDLLFLIPLHPPGGAWFLSLCPTPFGGLAKFDVPFSLACPQIHASIHFLGHKLRVSLASVPASRSRSKSWGQLPLS